MSSLDFSKLGIIHLVLIEKDVLINFDWCIDHEVNVEFILKLKIIIVVSGNLIFIVCASYQHFLLLLS